MNPVHATTLRRLEATHGVRIADDALSFAVRLLQVYENEPHLRTMDAIHLVGAACLIDLDREERLLDWDEYYLHRAFVEATELRKEKSVVCRTDVLPRVEEELAELTGKWDRFRKRWFKVLEQQIHESGKRSDLLLRLSHSLKNFIKTTYPRLVEGAEDADADAEGLSHFPALIDGIVDQIKQTVHSAFVDVGTFEVAQAASELTDLPAKCFYPPFGFRTRLRIEDLKSRLSKKLIAMDGVIDKIERVLLSKQESERGPLGSFLLLGPNGCGKTKLAQVLAEEIYGDEDSCIELDASVVDEPHLVRFFLYHLTRFNRNGYVVIFENIEDVPTFSDEVLPQIINDGILADNEQFVSFSNTIVLVSSHVGHEVFLDCECFHNRIPKIRFRRILANRTLLHNDCRLADFCTEVTNEYSPEFLDLFNDLLVFPFLSLQNHMAISRLQARDAALNMMDLLNKQVILYPSDAALVNMMNREDIAEVGAHAYDDWYEAYMRPRLNEHDLRNEAGDMLIIYIDQLVGLGKEFSFRVENGRHLERNTTFESLSALRSIYRREKTQSRAILRLQLRCSHLCQLLNTKPLVDLRSALEVSWHAINLITPLLVPNQVMQLDYFISEAEVSGKLQRSLKQQDRATQAVTEALLRSLRISKDKQSKVRAASILCLGLSPKSKKQFVGSLLENLVMDDGKQLVVQVDLSQCRNPGSFFRCRNYNDVLLTEVVKRSPNSVVVFHRLEMAHFSVLNTILSILDSGVAVDSKGKKTSFKNCVVVIISDLGNKKIISKLIRDRIEDESAAESSSTYQMVPRGLRYEVLYRLDELWLFDPFSDDQLNRFCMLPMKQLEEKDHSLYQAFSDLINVVCQEKNLDVVMHRIDGAVGKDLKIGSYNL